MSAELAREALANRRYEEARAALANAAPTPDTICETALLRMREGRENEALALLDAAQGGVRHARLLKELCEHAYCLTQLTPTDPEARAVFEMLRARHVDPLDGVGTRVSACLIVRNEEANLARCLRSLEGVVDEVVVVDTGSTDATETIARAHGAIVGRFPWCDDFAAARNVSLDLATGHWALWIDADEELDPASVAAIRRAIVRPHFGGFDLEIVNFTDGREAGSEFRHWPTRLFRRVAGVRFEGRVHEQITPSLMALGLPWARLEGARLLHYGYRPEAMREKGKSERTIGMLEREVREAPTDPFHWFNLANAYLVGKRLAECEHAAKRCVALMPDGAEYGKLAYQILAQAATGLGRMTTALGVCVEADRRGFGGIQNEFERATALLKANRPHEALIAANHCLTLDWPAGLVGDQGIFTHKRLVLRGQILAVLGDFEEALAMLDAALAVDPGFPPAQYSRGAVLERLGRPTEALAAFSLSAADDESFVLATKSLGRVLGTMGRHAESAESYRAAWERAPEEFEAWVGWASACEAAGDVPGLIAAYEAFARIHEPSADILVNWGRALDAAGETERALHCFTEAIRREPNLANAYFNCGDLLYRLGAPSDAAHLYEAGLRHDPMNPEAWFTLGNALYQSGIVEAAVRAYDQALILNPNHAKARHNLALVTEDLAAA